MSLNEAAGRPGGDDGDLHGEPLTILGRTAFKTVDGVGS